MNKEFDRFFLSDPAMVTWMSPLPGLYYVFGKNFYYEIICMVICLKINDFYGESVYSYFLIKQY